MCVLWKEICKYEGRGVILDHFVYKLCENLKLNCEDFKQDFLQFFPPLIFAPSNFLLLFIGLSIAHGLRMYDFLVLTFRGSKILKMNQKTPPVPDGYIRHPLESFKGGWHSRYTLLSAFPYLVPSKKVGQFSISAVASLGGDFWESVHTLKRMLCSVKRGSHEKFQNWNSIGGIDVFEIEACSDLSGSLADPLLSGYHGI